MLSFWEKEHFTTYDYAVVGAGITGLSVAAELIEKYPNCSVLVLERGLLPSGASTKNAGFACFGSWSELNHDLQIMGPEALLKLVSYRIAGLDTLRNRLGDKEIDFQKFGGYELILESEVGNINLDEINDLLWPLFNKKVFDYKPDLIKPFGFNSNRVHQLIYNPFEGQIDTGLMMRKLQHYVASKGVVITTGAQVNGYALNNGFVELDTQTIDNKPFHFKASKVLFCTNAFTNAFFPELVINPGRGQVLVTEPIPNLPFKGSFSFDGGYYYFRNFNNRVIFGGGRNLDFVNETTTSFELNEKIQTKLEWYLRELILPNTKFKIEQKWSGIMAFGNNKEPIVKKISDQILVGARLNGMGVAIGSNIAKQLIALL
jgi:glycine/D-amino acid oxidase-like deaminating enzyme